jgi:hypothetical protein
MDSRQLAQRGHPGQLLAAACCISHRTQLHHTQWQWYLHGSRRGRLREWQCLAWCSHTQCRFPHHKPIPHHKPMKLHQRAGSCAHARCWGHKCAAAAHSASCAILASFSCSHPASSVRNRLQSQLPPTAAACAYRKAAAPTRPVCLLAPPPCRAVLYYTALCCAVCLSCLLPPPTAVGLSHGHPH